jgi:hypothetical protein
LFKEKLIIFYRYNKILYEFKYTNYIIIKFKILYIIKIIFIHILIIYLYIFLKKGIDLFNLEASTQTLNFKILF